MVRLTTRVWFTGNIRPACLESDPNDIAPNVKLTVLGWGVVSAESWFHLSKIMENYVILQLDADIRHRESSVDIYPDI